MSRPFRALDSSGLRWLGVCISEIPWGCSRPWGTLEPGLCEVCTRARVHVCPLVCAHACIFPLPGWLLRVITLPGQPWGGLEPRVGAAAAWAPGAGLADTASVPQAPVFLFLSLGTCGRSVHPSSTVTL